MTVVGKDRSPRVSSRPERPHFFHPHPLRVGGRGVEGPAVHAIGGTRRVFHAAWGESRWRNRRTGHGAVFGTTLPEKRVWWRSSGSGREKSVSAWRSCRWKSTDSGSRDWPPPSVSCAGARPVGLPRGPRTDGDGLRQVGRGQARLVVSLAVGHDAVVKCHARLTSA